MRKIFLRPYGFEGRHSHLDSLFVAKVGHEFQVGRVTSLVEKRLPTTSSPTPASRQIAKEQNRFSSGTGRRNYLAASR